MTVEVGDYSNFSTTLYTEYVIMKLILFAVVIM